MLEMSYLLLPNQDAAGFCGSDSDVIFPAGSLGRSGSKTLAKRSRTELPGRPGRKSPGFCARSGPDQR